MLNTVHKVETQLQGHIIQGLSHIGFNHTFSVWLWVLATTLAIFLFSFFSFSLLKRYLLSILDKQVKKRKQHWAKMVFDHRVLTRLLHLIPAFIIYSCAPLVAAAPVVHSVRLSHVFDHIGLSYMLITLFFAISALLDVIENRYRYFKLTRHSALKGYFQILKILLFIVTAILVVSQLLDKSPFYLLSSVGVAATLIFVSFKNNILGFVTSLQVASSDLIRVGDWIEVPQYQADGTVLEITLNTVTVQNFDNAIISIPTYTLFNNSLKNWRGMTDAGARRILRGFNIDVNSITNCDARLLERLKQKNILSEKLYSSLIAKRQLTNVHVFRVYVQEYLETHPQIHKEMKRIVRYLESNISGLPIQIYAYATSTDTASFELIQSEIFEHLFAVLPHFGLYVFQNPSGSSLAPVSAAEVPAQAETI